MAGHFLSAVLDGDGALHGDVDALVPWWSVTKTVLAAAALRLVQDGRLALDAPLAAGFTLRLLLRHRAGLADYGMLPAYHAAVAEGAAPWPVADMRRRVADACPAWTPDSRFLYSNVGYLHVAELIAAATGDALDSALQHLIFRPLGLAGARVARTRADLAAARWGNAADYDPGWVYHGLVVGTLGEASRMLRGVLDGDLLAPALKAEMRDAQPVPDALLRPPWTCGGYGLGLMVGAGAGRAAFVGHTGQGPGSTIAVYRGPDGHVAAVAAPVMDQGVVEDRAMRLASR